jgi:heme/copper-type cytochrome/quinol oxidase subunit 1
MYKRIKFKKYLLYVFRVNVKYSLFLVYLTVLAVTQIIVLLDINEQVMEKDVEEGSHGLI